MAGAQTHVGLVVADTRRAIAWERALGDRGIDVVRAETRGDDADRGDWQILVHREDQRAAQAFVTAVLRGDESLPVVTVLPRSARWALTGVAVTVVVVVAVALLGGLR